MAIYAISDFHFSFDPHIDKPMDIYGARWVNHAERLKQNWNEIITEKDTVIVPGDISWGLRPHEAFADLDWIKENLPGRKLFFKGNHELWWQSVSKLAKRYNEGDMIFLQNTFAEAEGYAVCGTRGWICPGFEEFGQDDEKIYKREILRLEMSLEAARKSGYEKIIGALHFPPTNDKKAASGFTELFEKYGVDVVVYGHLHGKDVWPKGLQGIYKDVNYKLVSLDYLDAKPICISDMLR